MGILNFVFGNSKQTDFTPNFNSSEYDNWLNFLRSGGTSGEWEQLKSRNNWRFREDHVETFMQYQKKLKPISDKYYNGMEKIQSDWSILYNLKDYNGARANKYESDCKTNIQLYKQMTVIEKQYGDRSAPSVPAYKRLAMLYEKQENFEESISICCEALREGANGDGMSGRLVRMIRKAGRNPTEYELSLLNTYVNE